MQALFSLWLKLQSITKLGKYGPSVAAFGVLLVNLGYLLQGKVEQLDIDSVLLAIGLLGARGKLVTSQDVKARPDASA